MKIDPGFGIVNGVMPFGRAEDADVPALVHLINTAYEVEQFFVAGHRTNAAEIRELLDTGRFTIATGPSNAIIGCGYLETSGDRAYFGLLSVAPGEQGRGLGRALVAAMEDDARLAGSRRMDIRVVNLRADLLEFYERLGYVATATAPYEHRPLLQPCHFILMTKRLDSGHAPVS